jgi:predicted anti-sigma-YlaC factor YlaD
MDCEKIKSLLTEYIDGELGNGPRGEIESHLQSCHNCRRLKEALTESSVEPLKMAQRVKAPEDLWQKIKGKIEETKEGPIAESVLERLRLALHVRRPAIALATAAVVLLIAIAIITSQMQRPGPIARYIEEQADFFIYLAGENGTGYTVDAADIGTDIEEYLL